jgi:hypothetical protein
MAESKGDKVMQLAQFRLGVPILRLNIRFHHSTPRHPTAFERVLLRICDRFHANEAYNSIPINRLFSDFLGVADPDALLEPTLQELVKLSVLRTKSIDLRIDQSSLRELEVTDLGRNMLVDDQLPSHLQMTDETFLYDPVSKVLLSQIEGKVVRDNPPEICVDGTVFKELLPEGQIRMHATQAGYPWWNKSSRIERVECHSESQICWREVAVTILSDGAAVTFETKNPDQAAYINGLPPLDLYQRLLLPAFTGHSNEWGNCRELPPCELADCIDGESVWTSVANAEMRASAENSVWLVDKSSPHIAIRDNAASKQALICYDTADDPGMVQIQWNEAHDGCMVKVGIPFPIPGLTLASTGEAISCHRVEVDIHGERHDLPMAKVELAQTPRQDVLSALARVEELLGNSTMENAEIIPALWTLPADYWSRAASVTSRSAGDISKKVDRLLNMREHFTRLQGNIESSIWDDAVTRVVEDHLNLKCSLDYDELDALMSHIETSGIGGIESRKRLIELIVQFLFEPKGIDDFGRIAAAVQRGGKTWSIPFPSRMHTKKVLRSMADSFSDAETARALSNDNIFENTFQQLHRTHLALESALGGKVLNHPKSEDELLAVLKSGDAGVIGELSSAWTDRYRVLSDLVMQYALQWENSVLDEAAQQVEVLTRLSKKLVGALNRPFRNVFVVDTSALLLHPELLTRFSHDDFVVVSKKVIDELDDKKQDPSLVEAVTHVTRLLRTFPSFQIDFSDGDMSLLSPDYRKKGDNLILSVAVKYRKHRPTLLTNDNLLSLKAEAEGIAAMKSDAFMTRVIPSQKAHGPRNTSDQRSRSQTSNNQKGTNPRRGS